MLDDVEVVREVVVEVEVEVVVDVEVVVPPGSYSAYPRSGAMPKKGRPMSTPASIPSHGGVR